MFTMDYKGSRVSGPTAEAVRAFIAELKAAEGRRARWPAEASAAMAALGASSRRSGARRAWRRGNPSSSSAG
jgi:hypothetical protein